MLLTQEENQMNPSNLVLMKLAAVCDRLAASDASHQLTQIRPEDYITEGFLIDKISDPSVDEDQSGIRGAP